MAIREIVKEGDDVLLKKCRDVEKFDERTQNIIDDMLETLEDSGGVGLAAPQIGILRKIVVIQVDPNVEPYVLINPEITETSGKQVGIEGCLSLPGQWGIVERPYKVKAKALNRNGEMYELYGEGLLARAICHELDHLNGTIYKTKADKMLTPPEIEQFNNGEFDFEEIIEE